MRPRIIIILFLITFSLAGQKTDLKELLSYSFPTELIAAKKKGAIASRFLSWDERAIRTPQRRQRPHQQAHSLKTLTPIR